MQKLAMLLGIILFSSNTLADYSGVRTIDRVRVDTQYVYFGVTPTPANTCNNWGEELKFDHSTEYGKSFLSTLLSAKATNAKVDLWYHASSAPGTTQENGCGSEQVSVLTGIAIR